MDQILQTATQAAKEAGDLIQSYAKDIASLNVEQKSLHDYVSEVDRASEDVIIKLINTNFPAHRIKGEERGEHVQQKSDYCWIIDPLDGTTNFLREIPHYAVSIAVLYKNEPHIAVVYDPAKGEMFCAIKGQGAFVNNKPIQCSSIASAKGGLYATGVPFSGKPLEQLDAFTNTMQRVLAIQTSGIRRLGAAALDLAYVAAGRYDGFWESNLQIWDIAAGVLLVQEAGGVVTDLHGNNTFLESGNILAASSGAFPELLRVCASEY